MAFAWKGLFPMSLLNMFLIAVEIQVFQDDAGVIPGDSLIVMAAINWAAAAATIVVFAHLLGQGRLRRPEPVPSPLANMAEGG